MAGWAGSARAGGRRGGAPKTARRIREAGAAGPLATGRRRGLNITAAVWNAGFHWWRSVNKRTQNVIEYMLVLALCLVLYCPLLQLAIFACSYFARKLIFIFKSWLSFQHTSFFIGITSDVCDV